MNKEDKSQIVDLLSAMLNEYHNPHNGNDISDMHYIDLAFSIAIRYKSPIPYNEVEVICDYIGVNHTASINGYYDRWKNMAIKDRFGWIEEEIDKLENNLSYQPRTLTDMLPSARPILELINKLLETYDTYGYDYDKENNNNNYLYVITKMLLDELITYAEYRIMKDYLYDHMPDWFRLLEDDEDYNQKFIAWLNLHITTIQPEIEE